MHERVQQALDGQLRRDSLTAAEAAELRAVERAISRTLEAIPGEPIPDLAGSVLSRIGAVASNPGPAPRTGVIGWLWSPRPVSWTFRPVYALAAVALLVVAALLSPGVPPSGEDPLATTVLVQFQLEAPGAAEVRLAGDFSNWEPGHLMTRTESGVWRVFVPLTPGVHEYAFVIDGNRWVPDPAAPAVSDGFGGVNSRVAVLSGMDLGL